ncbi:hypothetical protein KCTC52924_00364 [Arenibacter antarcticus]|uniref:DoxX-like family protein n=1 Tax=Arenibacter antarcticus TaxID=2040469 RepID=A0ABW5VC26_9FLAO|nr:hypothetical protein [Arenibacter sp. H213]MCM4169583.1 hypothetical protein [Arenibacter sp. H213]
MTTIIAKWIVLVFGSFIIVVGFLMLFAPEKARATLRKAGSTTFINYAEITLRLIPATAMILYANSSKVPLAFTIFGGFMIITSLVLYFVPRKTHHNFSLQSAAVLKPSYFQWISPLAFLLGGLIIFNTVGP